MKRFLLLLLLTYIASPCYAYIEKNLKVLTMENGMPNNTVNRIYRDNDGFMWFATKKGITRYDGSSFRNFVLPGTNQIVTNLFGSTKDYIWIWGMGELNCFNTETEMFMEIDYPKEVVENNTIYTSKVYNDSIAWLITTKSVFKTIVTTNATNTKRTLNLISEQLNIVDNNESILSTDIDSIGNLYLSTNQNRLLIIDIENRTIEKHKLNLRKSLASDASRILHINVIGNSVWLNTSGQGLVRFFIDTKEVQQFDDYPNTKLRIPHSNVFQTAKLNSNQYLFVTWNGYNVITYDQTDRIPISITNYSNSYSDTHRIMECRIGSVYIDKDNILWLGTFGSGIIISNLNLQFYKQFHQDVTNAIESMTMDPQQYLWISTYHKGVFRSKKPYINTSNLEFELVRDNIVKGVKTYSPWITCDNQGRVWGGMGNMTIIRYGKKGSDKEIEITIDSLPDKKLTISCIYFDKRGDLWIGTSKGVLYVYDLKAGKARVLKDVPHIRINDISEDKKGNLWFSSVKGVIKYDPSQEIIRRYADNFSVNSTLVTKERTYISTTNGLLLIGSTGDSTLLTTRNGLCDDHITKVIEGFNGEIWICSNSGISRYSTTEKTFFNYYVQSNNTSAVRAEDGTLFFGNNKSITYFDPAPLSTLYQRLRNKKVMITELRIVGQTVSAGDTVNGDIVLRKSIQHTDRIVLNHKNNSFSLSISNLLFNNVHQRCMYRILPVQPNWAIINNSEPISYMALPEGTYKFQVTDYTNEITDDTPITELEIRVNAHWIYSSIFRIIIFMLLLLLIVVVFFRMRVRYKNQLYLSQLNSELESHRAELNRERKTNKERVNFFTYASHELRTPLTLIISPITELLSNNGVDSEVKRKLFNIEQNAQSLLNITNKLLDFQQLDAKITKLNISKTDVLELTLRVISNFNLLCADNNIEIKLTNHTDLSQVWFYVDQPKIESVINNLISNSIKYRKVSGAEIEIIISKERIDSVDYITIVVKDNGQSISNQAQKTIFESFSTDTNNPLFSTKMGVGLFIVRNIIELHHGKITLSSALNDGTTITLQVPQNYGHHNININPTNAQEEVVPNSKPNKNRTILIIEDNVDVLKYIRSLFCNSYNVLTAENGEDGLVIAKEKLPNIILQDVMLPGISGIECCEQLIQNYETSHIPVILLSAQADEQSIMDGSKAGAADYVVKPFNPQILKAKVSSLINSREMLKQIYSKSLMLNGASDNKVFEDNFMQKIINITEQNLINPEFGVELLAEKLNMSTSTMRRHIKSHSNLPVNSIIRDVRLTKAASLIITQKYRVIEVAEMVGYNDISSFRSQFTKKFGISPSKFHNA